MTYPNRPECPVCRGNEQAPCVECAVAENKRLQANNDALIEAMAEKNPEPGLPLSAVRWNKLVDQRTDNYLRAERLQEVVDTTLRRLRVVEEVVLRETLAIEDTWNKYVPQDRTSVGYNVRHSLRTLINNIDGNVRSARKLLEQEITSDQRR